MKKFIISVLCVSVFFIGLGNLVENTTANKKSDAQALELIKKARIAIGGDTNINNVRSLTLAAETTNFFDQGNIKMTKGGNLEIALELPNRFSKMLRIGNPGDSTEGEKTEKQVDVIILKKGGDEDVFWKTTEGDDVKVGDNKIIIKKDANGKVLTEDIVGPKTVIVKDADGKVLTEDITGNHKTVISKEVRVTKAREMQQNELIRTTLALLLTAPEGTDISYIYKGENTIDGFSVNVVEAQINGSAFKLFLDKSSNLPKMISFMGLKSPELVRFNKPVGDFPKEFVIERGDIPASVEHQITFSDYRSVNGLLLPFAWTETVGGKQTQTVNVTNYEINPPNIADKFNKSQQKIMIRTEKP